MGRTRGGLTTKIHAFVDAEDGPIRLKLTEGQAHDGRSAADITETLGLGQILLADRAYDSDALPNRIFFNAIRQKQTSTACPTMFKDYSQLLRAGGET